MAFVKQKRGVSRLYIAPYTYDAETKTVTFGTPKQIEGVKSISRTLSQAKEAVNGDNKRLYDVYGATEATRTFEVTGVSLELEAELMGQSVVRSGDRVFTGTAQDGNEKPYFAFLYALHDGDKTRPCEVVCCFKGQVQSITKESSTIDSGTTSTPQTIEVQFYDPDVAWTATGKYDLDISLEITADNVADVETWFTQVVTYDNINTIFSAE